MLIITDDVIYKYSTRGDQKVLQLPTLVNKTVKINGSVRISKYWLVINFSKNDDSFSVYDVIVTSLYVLLLSMEILNL